jgi:hypothetical protein
MRDRCRPVRVLVGALLALLLPLAAAWPAGRGPILQLIDSDPGPNAVLGAGEPLYLRFRYPSAVPIRILVSGEYRGDLVAGFAQDGKELFPAGDREAAIWLAYPGERRIDRIRVRLWNANDARLAEAIFPIEAAWTGTRESSAPARRETKSWVAELTPGQRARMAERSSAASEAGGFDPLDLLFLGVPGYFLLQIALMAATSGGWRRATLAPAVVMIPVLAYTVLAFAAQSNLWPLLLLFTAPLACLYLALLALILLIGRIAKAV